MSRIEAVFFDCDGTLVDSEVICSRAYVTMFQEFGIIRRLASSADDRFTCRSDDVLTF